MKRIIAMIIAGWLFALPVTAQITPGFEMQEVIRIGFTYRKAPYLSFNITYQYADSLQPNTILEEINGQYKINGNRYWAMLDSTEIVQGNNYNLAVHHDDKVMAVQKPQYTDSKVLQIPVMDSVFRRYIDSVSVSQVNDTTRLLRLHLKTILPYGNYEMRYNPRTYLVNSIQYFMKPVPGDTTRSTALVKISMYNYSKAVIPDDYFSENKFLYRDGSFYLRPQYSDYELLVNGDL